MKHATQKPHLAFPCTFPIKVMGDQQADLVKFVENTLAKNLQAPDSVEIESRHSKHKNYISVTATFTAHNKAELDKVYKLLTANPAVKMVL